MYTYWIDYKGSFIIKGSPLLVGRSSHRVANNILAIFYPPLKQIWGCVWLRLQAQEGSICFTESAERVEYGNYEQDIVRASNRDATRGGS